MACEQYEELIYQHSEGLLGGAEARRVERHVAECAACRELATELSALNDALQALPRASAPSGFASAVSKRIASCRPGWQREETSLWRWLPLPGAARRVAAFSLAAAFALVVMVAGSVIMTRFTGQPVQAGALLSLADTPREAVSALPIAVRRAGGFVQHVSRLYVPIGRRSPAYLVISLLLAANVLLYMTRPSLGRATVEDGRRFGGAIHRR